MARLTVIQSNIDPSRASIDARFFAYLTLAHAVTCLEWHGYGERYQPCKQFLIASLSRKLESSYGRS